MLQKCAILGLVLLLAGGAAFGWFYSEAQKERQQAQSPASANSLGSQEYIEKYGRWYQLSPEQQNQLIIELDNERKSKSADQLGQEQQARLTADLEKLAAGQMNPGEIADFLYGHGWESQVEQYRRHREETETAQTISIVCLSIGGALLGGCVILGLLRQLARGIRALRNRSYEPERETEPAAAELLDIALNAPEPPTEPEVPMPEEQPKQRRRLLTLSESLPDVGGTEPGASAYQPLTSIDDLFNVAPDGTGPREAAPKPRPGGPHAQAGGEESGIALLLSDEDSRAKEWSPEAQWSLQGVPNSQRVATAKDSLQEQAEDLQKQIAEVKQAAQSVQQVTREQANPLSNTLKELTQQVSAIREYAASQQNRVEKLQDGYDWGIIRTFCLRVIRCIDNLESRLANLPKGDGALRHLEEIRDEMLFALESSGVEQFQPEVNSEFHGQEKLAEALKEKQPAKKPEQAGRIARVIRPGYRYLIDDDNYRIVRTAQVKLYG